MVGRRNNSGKTRQLPKRMLEGKHYLIDVRNPDKEGHFTKYARVKEFDSVNAARRYANRQESNYHKTKIIESVDEHTQNPSTYYVYRKRRSNR